MRKVSNFVMFAGLFLLSFALSCSKEKTSYVFPQTFANVWKLQSQEPFQRANAPKSIQSLAMSKAWMGKYSNGLRNATVTVYETVADAVAFEALQKWRYEKGQMAINQGSYLIVVDSPDSDLAELETLIKAVEASLKTRSM